ncbi:MAG: DNA internalization-related competence protein ComEC/Rec2 [Armatimonadota bacterium]|nr:DNA internalization-related competence protein ComEC/Rec2 [Armatimonadota bacterium]MDR7474330.1 DNA internalization-related competence protein ComEC/Rec2 [Armatimonadota bacterium]MDR7539903.1 DNA internalization-related competence protein ComEC/Rec2 [Armatimonadota bacterium]
MGRPLVWVTLAFAAGILTADRQPADPAPVVLIAGAAYAAWVLTQLVLVPTRRAAGTGVLSGLLLCVFAALGYLTALLDPARQEAAAAAAWDGHRVTIQGVVAAPVRTGDGRQQVVVRLRRLDGHTLPRPFSVMATLPPQPALRYGDLIAARGVIVLPPDGGNPGEPSLRAALQRRGIAALLRVPPHRPATVVRRGAGHPLTAWVLGLRERFVAPLLALPPPYGGVLAGLLFGAQAGAGREMEELFLRAGLLHVLVVSGAQVGLLAASVVGMLALLRAHPALRFLLAGAVVLLFAAMVGWGAAVGRAAIMALVGLGAGWLRRDTDAATAMALAALLWLALYPAALFSLGFQLSFAATWGLIFLSPALEPPVRPRWLARLAGATLGAQLAVLPLLAVVFQRVSLAAFPANLLVLPIVAVLVPAGFVLSLVGLVLPPAAFTLAPAFLPPVWAIVALARLFAGAPGAEVWLPPVAWWQAVAAYLLLGALPRLRRGVLAIRGGVRWVGLAVWALLVAALLFTGSALPGSLGPRLLVVSVLDVGQGDAILVQSPSGRVLLVDGGGEVELPGRLRGDAAASSGEAMPARTDVGMQRVVPALRRLGVRRLDVIVLSHAHEDHVGGLPAVLQNFSVDLVLEPGVPHASPSYARFLELVRQRRTAYALARQGQRIDLGDGAAAHVLWPPEDGERRGAAEQVNARSVVARLSFGRFSVLLTGDIEAETEAALVHSGGLQSTVLKVAHHGSRTSTTPLFVDAVHPVYAVISVGRGNFFGHPHAQTLRTLEQRGIRVYRTDRDGAVILRSDGRWLAVETVRQSRLR